MDQPTDVDVGILVVRDLISKHLQIGRDCQFGVSPVNYSDSESDSKLPHIVRKPLVSGTKPMFF